MNNKEDLDILNYLDYCNTCGIEPTNEDSLENYLDWTRNAIENRFNF